jgi:hypothetical protein
LQAGRVDCPQVDWFDIVTPPLYAGLCETSFQASLKADTDLLHDAIIPVVMGTPVTLRYHFYKPERIPQLIIENQHIEHQPDLPPIKSPKARLEAHSMQVMFLIDGTMHPKNIQDVKKFVAKMCRDLAHQDIAGNIQAAAVLYGDYRSPPDVSPYLMELWNAAFAGESPLGFETYPLDFEPITDFKSRWNEFMNSFHPMGQVVDYCNALELGLMTVAKFPNWNAKIWHVVLLGNSPPHPPTSGSNVDCFTCNDWLHGEAVDWMLANNTLRNRARQAKAQLHFHSLWVEPVPDEEHPIDEIHGRRLPDREERAYAKKVWETLSTPRQRMELMDNAEAIWNAIRDSQSRRWHIEQPLNLPMLSPMLEKQLVRPDWCK